LLIIGFYEIGGAKSVDNPFLKQLAITKAVILIHDDRLDSTVNASDGV
jgi:hypothetical protein